MDFEAFKQMMKTMAFEARHFNESFHMKLKKNGAIHLILGFINPAHAGPDEYITRTWITMWEYMEYREGRLPESVIRGRFEKMMGEILDAMLESVWKKRA